jgi:hypothetical protein
VRSRVYLRGHKGEREMKEKKKDLGGGEERGKERQKKEGGSGPSPYTSRQDTLKSCHRTCNILLP